MNALVVGQGSIGARHARVLEALGCSVGVVTARDVQRPRVFRTIREGVSEFEPAYAVVANATAGHRDALLELRDAGFSGRVLVEKPLFDSVQPVPENEFENVWVGYNLRFHPVVRRLRQTVAGRRVISVQAYVGQYLPEWRPWIDYRACYSASRAAGGGVLRDLSHEIDYLQWIFGSWTALTAVGGHYSSLEIDSDDVFGLMIRTEQVPLVMVQMNYLDRVGRRDVVVVTDEATYRADLRSGEFFDGSTREITESGGDDTYAAEHRAAVEDGESLCTIEQAFATMEAIGAAERASGECIWVTR